MRIKTQIDRAFEVMGLRQLGEYTRRKTTFIDADDEWNVHYESEPKAPLWKRVLTAFKDISDLRAQNAKLTRDLLVYKQLAQDSGRVGLNLFYENEAMEKVIKDLRLQLKDPVEYKEGILFWSESCDKAGRELKEVADKYAVLYSAYKRLEEAISDDIRKKLDEITP
jgi:hypothetical protein